MTRARTRHVLTTTVLLLALTACGDDEPGSVDTATSTSSSAAPPTSSTTEPRPTSPTPTSLTPTPTPTTPTTTPPLRPPPREAWVRGVDASHHQGDIDWPRVARDDIAFAYLKASEGSTFADPRFAENAESAREAGLRVGGYHYFSLCSPGAAQADHFVEVLRGAGADAGPATMPPAVDLEIQGQCSTPPGRDDLLAQVRTFLDDVEEATGSRVVVYEYPDFEEKYRFADELQRRQWVRRLGDTPPDRAWWIWQRADDASIDGIDGPADLNLIRELP